MMLGSVHYEGCARIALRVGEESVAILGRSGDGCPNHMLDVIRAWSDARKRFSEALPNAPVVRADRLSWLPPVGAAAKVISVVFDGTTAAASRATVTMKSASSLVGHLGTVSIKPRYGGVFARPALAALVGVSDVGESPRQVPIFGYTLMNDITAPDMCRAGRSDRAVGEVPGIGRDVDMPGFFSSIDSFGPIGPFIVVNDMDVDLQDAAVVSSVDGYECARWSTAALPGSIPNMLSSLSEFVRLRAGDVVAFSMMGGSSIVSSGADLAEARGEVKIEIQNLCTLVNPVRRR
ncbi:fumarylacetoacetate hydrolase family protein [Paraburkholderia sp. SIMBA_030]|uniref:fumarylacetoacetate hydrolase family protein n=1 Tax=Paraburkholderia sp. SIMBA_030 TaxID=3085773 RepID=UPI0039786F36